MDGEVTAQTRNLTDRPMEGRMYRQTKVNLYVPTPQREWGIKTKDQSCDAHEKKNPHFINTHHTEEFIYTT